MDFLLKLPMNIETIQPFILSACKIFLTTGGEDYENDGRDPDLSRAAAVQAEAAKLILHFQKYRRQKLTVFRSLRIGFIP